MPLAWLKRLIGAAALCGAPASAHAGAWVLTEEQTIVTASAGETEDGAAYEGALYSEGPIGKHFSLVTMEWMKSEADGFGGRSIRSESALGAKMRLDDQGRVVSALQLEALWRHDRSLCPEAGVELRYLSGLSFQNGAFLNAEAAARGYGGQCEEQRFELTAGYRPTQNWLTLGEMFAQFPDDGDANVKLQVSAVRFVAEDWGVQLGLRRSVAGDEGPLMLILGVWH